MINLVTELSLYSSKRLNYGCIPHDSLSYCFSFISMIGNRISIVVIKTKDKEIYWKWSDQCPSKSKFYARSTGFNILWEQELRNSKISQWIGIPVNLIFINKVDSELKQLILSLWYIRNSKLYIELAAIFRRTYNFLTNESQKNLFTAKDFLFLFTRILTSTQPNQTKWWYIFLARIASTFFCVIRANGYFPPVATCYSLISFCRTRITNIEKRNSSCNKYEAITILHKMNEYLSDETQMPFKLFDLGKYDIWL